MFIRNEKGEVSEILVNVAGGEMRGKKIKSQDKERIAGEAPETVQSPGETGQIFCWSSLPSFSGICLQLIFHDLKYQREVFFYLIFIFFYIKHLWISLLLER